MEPEAGNRFVAFDVLIENLASTRTHYASSYNFQIADTDDFAYEATAGWAEPSLNGTDLGAGQKTRGWVTFEVSLNAVLKTLTYDPDYLTIQEIHFDFQ